MSNHNDWQVINGKKLTVYYRYILLSLPTPGQRSFEFKILQSAHRQQVKVQSMQQLSLKKHLSRINTEIVSVSHFALLMSRLTQSSFNSPHFTGYRRRNTRIHKTNMEQIQATFYLVIQKTSLLYTFIYFYFYILESKRGTRLDQNLSSHKPIYSVFCKHMLFDSDS